MSNSTARPRFSASIRTLRAALTRAVSRFESTQKPARHGHTEPAVRVQACGGVECDGYGWINGATDGYQWARPCPDCRPEVRRGAAPRN